MHIKFAWIAIMVWLVFISLLSCQARGVYIANSYSSNCEKGIEALLHQVYKFEPKELRFDNSIEKDVVLSSLLGKTNLKCEAKEREVKQIVCILLLKQYIYHLKCCNQSYDLLSMNDKSARKIIDYYLLITNRNESSLEMLSSRDVVGYSRNDIDLCSISYINNMFIEIIKQENRILDSDPVH